MKIRRCRLLGLPNRIVILDTECTTWEGALNRNWSGPGEHREVVQLGAVLVETIEFIEISTFSGLVKPKINPALSDYFMKLTGIKQEDVNLSVFDFDYLLGQFHKWCQNYQIYTFDSMSDSSRLFDRDVLVENCKLYGIKFPFELEQFHNINEIFHKHGYMVKQSGAAPEAFGVKSPARSHDALNDVRGLILGLKLLSDHVKV